MRPAKRKATSARHAKAKRAAKRSGRSARAKRAARKGGVPGTPERGPKKKKNALRPKLQVVTRPAPKPLPVRTPVEVTEFSGAKAGANSKDLALFGLERARVAVHAAIQGLGPGAANRPVAPDKWSPREMVLHLAFWDREIVQKHLEPAASRNQRADIRRSQIDSLNAEGVKALEHHDWEAAMRLLQAARENLWDALDSIPAEPAEVWSPEHAVGELVREVTDHDRHHAEIIKRWRAETGA